MLRALKNIKRFQKETHGTASIEFVILFPLLMTIFLMGFESGLYMVRSVMLERGVNLAVRDIRIGGNAVHDIQSMKAAICQGAVILPDCVNSVQVELTTVDITPGALAARAGPIRCIDKQSNLDPSTYTSYDIGRENQLMLVRVCALSQPFFPTTRFSQGLAADGQGNYATVAISAFVNEPGRRSVVASGSGGSSSGGSL